jgi:SNF2 family DNA or RNA helicase
VFNDKSSGVNTICINKAGGSSLDLQQASIEIFYDLPWSWGEWTQVLGRARRIGSPHEKVLVILLINSNTIDEYSLRVLRRKESLVDQTIGLDVDTLTISPETLDELYEMIRKAA